MSKKKMITRKTNIGELIEKHPQLAQILVQDYGLHCAGCCGAAFDTLESGAQSHGMSDKEIDKMVKKLEQLASKKK